MSASYPVPDNMHWPEDEEYGVTKKHNPDLTDAAWDKRWKGADEVKRKEIFAKFFGLILAIFYVADLAVIFGL